MDNKEQRFFESYEPEDIEDAIHHISALATDPGFRILITAMEEERKLSTDLIPYIEDDSKLRQQQGFIRAIDMMLSYRKDLIAAMSEFVESQKEDDPDEHEEFDRPLDEDGL